MPLEFGFAGERGKFSFIPDSVTLYFSFHFVSLVCVISCVWYPLSLPGHLEFSKGVALPPLCILLRGDSARLSAPGASWGAGMWPGSAKLLSWTWTPEQGCEEEGEVTQRWQKQCSLCCMILAVSLLLYFWSALDS